MYLLADILYFLIYHVIRYRRDIVAKNLLIAFPDMDKKQRKSTTKQFYKNMADFIVEVLWPKNVKFNVIGSEIFYEYAKVDRNLMLLCGHQFNWELTNIVSKDFPQKRYPVYKKLSNKWVEKRIIKYRSSTGAVPFEMNDVYKTMLQASKEGNSAFLFVADQRPHFSQIRYDLTFFGKDTPVFNGFDKMARKLGYAVIFSKWKKEKRGEYTITFSEITEDASTLKENEVTNIFFAELEKAIIEQPHNWLWTHDRWKYTKGVEY